MADALLVRCPSCDGYGWLIDDDTNEPADCDWCLGNGYVLRDARGVDTPIAEADYARLAADLERLEAERLHDMGYTGGPKKPWEQAVRGENAERMRRRDGNG